MPSKSSILDLDISSVSAGKSGFDTQVSPGFAERRKQIESLLANRVCQAEPEGVQRNARGKRLPAAILAFAPQRKAPFGELQANLMLSAGQQFDLDQ